MKNFKFGLVSALALFAATPSLADLTAAQVWENLRTQIQINSGAKIEIGAIEETDGRIIVRDVTSIFHSDEMTVKSILHVVNIQELGTGSVEVTFPENLDMFVRPSAEQEVQFDEMHLNVIYENYKDVYSGTVEDMHIVTSASAVRANVPELHFNDDAQSFLGNFAIHDFSAQTWMSLGDEFSYKVEGEFGLLEGVVNSGVKSSDTINMNFAVEDIKYSMDLDGSTGNILLVSSGVENIANFSGGYSVGKMIANLSMKHDSSSVNFSMGHDGSQLQVNMKNGDEIGLSAIWKNVSIALDASDFLTSGPLSVNLEEFTTNWKAPLSQNIVDDYMFGVKVSNLKLSDALWNFYDADKVLPRDAVNLDVQFSGLMESLLDLTKSNYQEEAEPGLLHSLNIDRLHADAVGVAVDGEGSFLLDHSDSSFNADMPFSEVNAKVTATGVNALLDNLMEMGLLNQQDAAGMRMALMMFTVSGENDSISSELEITPEGHVSVNGRRIQ